jgi:RNA polymerase sigma factor (sigma-70 family)
MQVKSDIQLLREYAFEQSEAAFGEIVRRYADQVFSAAWRQVGSRDWAAEVAQRVFIDLARKAFSLAKRPPPGGSVAGWLHRATRYAALTLLRDEHRRHAREGQIMQDLKTTSESSPDWADVAPFLDEAIASLSGQERDALLLRFFNNQDFRAIGVALGVSDDAAQKRVARGLEKLRARLLRRGVTTTVAALSTALSTHAVQAAPVGSAAAWVSASIVGTSAEAATTLTLFKAMSLTKLQIGIGAVVIGGLAVTIAIQHDSERAMRLENQDIRRQLAVLNAGNTARSNDGEQVESSRSIPDNQFRELLRLRGEVGVLRDRLAKLDSARTNEQARILQTTPDPANTNQTHYYPANTWTNVEFGSPRDTAVSFLWALKQGDMSTYKAALGRKAGSNEQFPPDWGSALEAVEGSSISEVTQTPEGNPSVSIVHQFRDGGTENTYLQFRLVDGSYQISSYAGYPIGLIHAVP